VSTLALASFVSDGEQAEIKRTNVKSMCVMGILVYYPAKAILQINAASKMVLNILFTMAYFFPMRYNLP
jgi:hypothetical protein